MAAPDNPKCSVCVANYNGMNFIDSCLQSVLNQEFEGGIEIIIHDDASTDDSVNYIRSKYPQVNLIESIENVGFCVSNNRMVEKATGEYILLLNNDAELFSDAISTLYAKAKQLDTPSILGLPQFDALTNKLIDIGSTYDLFLNPVPNLNRNIHDVGMIIGACLWMPRSLWNELGGFPDWFGSLAEDMYICNIARLFGYPVIAVPESGFKHWVGQSLGGGKILNGRLTTKLSRRVISERNKTFVMALTYPTPIFYVLFPLHLIVLLAEGLALSFLKRRWDLFLEIYWGCLKSQWRERRRLISQRKSIQNKRTIRSSIYWRVFSFVPHKLAILFRYGLPEIR